MKPSILFHSRGLRFALTGSLFLFLSCAAVRAPSGGPVDATPPTLIEILPPSESVHFKGGEIHFRFSEYMDETSLEKGINIFPRLESPVKKKFRGDELILKLPKDLKANQTYVITLGREVKDEHGVPMDEAVQVAYSTGDRIDNGEITGRVTNGDNISMHLWKITQTLGMDTAFFTEPDYISDVTDDGFYRFQYLSSGRYQILAIGRESAGQPLNPAIMRYGLHWTDQILIDSAETLANVNMMIWREPQPLRLLRGEWISSNWGRLIFNNELPPEISTEIVLTRETDQKLSPLYFQDPDDTRNLILVVTDSLAGKKISILVKNLQYRDEMLLDSVIVDLRVPDVQDTSYLELTSPKSKATIIPELDTGPPVSLIFSKPMKNSLTLFAFEMVKGDSDSVAIAINAINPMQINVEPLSSWEPNQSYTLKLFPNKYAGRQTLLDSVTTIIIKTTDPAGYGNLLGEVDLTGRSLLMTELYSVENSTNRFSSVVNSDSKFELKNIPEGYYLLLIFQDNDQNGEYTFGKAEPFKPAEWYLMYPDTLEIRANWDLDLAPVSIEELQ